MTAVSYEVFARKYRPQTFDDLVGQAHVSRTLKNAVAQNRLAHAYLFVGPRGIGKTSTARILAKSLNCIKGPTITPCGECDNCREIAAGNSLDVIEIDGASNNSVEDVRQLRENVRYAPAKGRYKIYLIDEVHMLSPAAFNALLKTLEEPPGHVKFIFATTEPQKVLPTILSRCQRFDLHRIPANLIAKHLQFIAEKEKITLEPAAAHAIARGAEGGLRDAESMLDQLVAFCGEKISENDVLNVFGFTSEQTVVDLTRRILRGETPDAIDLLHQQSESGKDMMRLMSDLIAYLRDLLVFKAKPDALKEDVEPDVQKSLTAHAELITTDRLLDLIDQFAAAEGRMKWAPNKKLHFEVAIIRAIQTLGQATLDEVIEKLGELRDGGETKTQPAGADSGESKPMAQTAGITAPGYSKTRVEEKSVTVEAQKVWERVLTKIPAQKGFVRNSASAAHVLGIEGRNLKLGFATADKAMMDILSTQANRKFVETLLHEITGKDWTLKLTVNEELASNKALPPEHSPSHDFKDEPLIQEAIELFNAKIRS
ncbi:MAG: DNA polymerase III subunit gamma/tau [Verrucomicrobia bacterium]|nr:MAG: DNA polymerase III subunit gamma/tau [Verrucomicrobiota bacterium]PYJ24324.1 MAG: DNA polymerase III subunit gamma/tau [Verrucomicrobiota bacterium]